MQPVGDLIAEDTARPQAEGALAGLSQAAVRLFGWIEVAVDDHDLVALAVGNAGHGEDGEREEVSAGTKAPLRIRQTWEVEHDALAALDHRDSAPGDESRPDNTLV
jgi:hypothetical protein